MDKVLLDLVSFIKDLYPGQNPVPLHAPVFAGNEKKYLNECIDTTYVSSIGKFVDLFEEQLKQYTGASSAVVCVNGTEALHLALKLIGVNYNDEVITQPLSFIATANAISYTGAYPVFVDVDTDTLSISPEKLDTFLKAHTIINSSGHCFNRTTKRFIKACLPMHTFGHPARLDEILAICKKYNIELIEDAAESLGSYYKNKHTGTFGRLGIISFNGNKTITTGGGGVILTQDVELGKRTKHLTTQAKIPHPWEFVHDAIGYNYRMPNINAALGLAQLEMLDKILESKRKVALQYNDFFHDSEYEFINEPKDTRSNFWLNGIICKNLKKRNEVLTLTNSNGIMTRPVWQLLNKMHMFKGSFCSNLENAIWLEERIVNLPSSPRI